MSEHLPVILIELVLVFGGVLAFGWWQLRSVRRDRQAAAARRELDRAPESPPQSEANSGTTGAASDERRP